MKKVYLNPDTNISVIFEGCGVIMSESLPKNPKDKVTIGSPLRKFVH